MFSKWCLLGRSFGHLGYCTLSHCPIHSKAFRGLWRVVQFHKIFAIGLPHSATTMPQGLLDFGVTVILLRATPGPSRPTKVTENTAEREEVWGHWSSALKPHLTSHVRQVMVTKNGGSDKELLILNESFAATQHGLDPLGNLEPLWDYFNHFASPVWNPFDFQSCPYSLLQRLFFAWSYLWCRQHCFLPNSYFLH